MKNVSYIVLIDANSSCVVVILLGGIPTEVGLLSGLTLLHLHSNLLTVSSSISLYTVLQNVIILLKTECNCVLSKGECTIRGWNDV